MSLFGFHLLLLVTYQFEVCVSRCQRLIYFLINVLGGVGNITGLPCSLVDLIFKS